MQLPPNQKEKDDRKEKIKGSWPETHTIHSVTHTENKQKTNKQQQQTKELLLRGNKSLLSDTQLTYLHSKVQN